MKKSLHPLVGRSRVVGHIQGAVRPGMEAAVLAAVAFGCAQAGWSILAPTAHGAVDTAGTEEAWRTGSDAASAARVAQEFRSSFAPAEESADGVSNAAAAYVATVQLSGIRISEDATRSGAVVTMPDGAQRAFMVGQDLTAGVRLSAVNSTGIVLEYEGGASVLSLQTAMPAVSFASAVLGRSAPVDSPSAIPVVATRSEALEETVAEGRSAVRSPFATAGLEQRIDVVPNRLSAALAVPEVAKTPGAAAVATADLVAFFGEVIRLQTSSAGPGKELVLDRPVPLSLQAMGLRQGDAIVAINGAGIGDAARVLGAIGPSATIELTLRRPDQGVILVKIESGSLT